MKVLVIGGGFTGLACGVELVDLGHEVVVAEKSSSLGGLGKNFKENKWKWNLEKFYHHIFTNDKEAIKMGERVGLAPFFGTPKTYSLIGDCFYQLDSPISLIKFSALPVIDRFRMGVGMAILKIIFNGRFFEKYRVVDLLPQMVGRKAYETVWEPMLRAKFGRYLDCVNMAWFWSRIYKRTQSLGYFNGGFGNLASKMGGYIKSRGGKIILNKEVDKKDFNNFDRVVLTVPEPVAKKLMTKISPSEDPIREPRRKNLNIHYLWAQTLVLELKESLMPFYWLNILNKKWPFLVVVEQTRFIDRKYYGGSNIVYLGNYLEEKDALLEKTDGELLKIYEPYLKKINPAFKKNWIKKLKRFKEPFAQPVIPVNYSRLLPTMKTSDPRVYVANMSMVYPWDRGVNYAIEAGIRVANLVNKN